MTARTAALTISLRASAAAGSAKQRVGFIRVGLSVTGTSPAWAGGGGNRAKVDWLPPAHVAWFDPQTGKPNPVFYQFIREVAEVRLGGVNGITVPQVATTVTRTQEEVVATQSYAAAIGTYAQGVAATATATAEVAQSNSLSGAGSIPDAPEPPPPPGTHAD